MTSGEIFVKCLPKSPSMIAGIGGKPELTWEDVMASLKGIRKCDEGLIRYVYLDDKKGRHDFYAGLMMEAMSREDVQQWVLKNPKKIDGLVRLAIEEWKHSRSKYSHAVRAHYFGVGPQTWRRTYQNIYTTIVGLPAAWEDRVLQNVKKQLKRV